MACFASLHAVPQWPPIHDRRVAVESSDRSLNVRGLHYLRDCIAYRAGNEVSLRKPQISEVRFCGVGQRKDDHENQLRCFFSLGPVCDRCTSCRIGLQNIRLHGQCASRFQRAYLPNYQSAATAVLDRISNQLRRTAIPQRRHSGWRRWRHRRECHRAWQRTGGFDRGRSHYWSCRRRPTCQPGT